MVDFLCVCMRMCVCVQAPLESINPKSNIHAAEAAFDVCWIPLWNMGCGFTCLFLVWNALLCAPHDASAVQQDRWLLCYEFVYNSGVFSPVLWSVILHLWSLLIPFLSRVSPLIFDPNLKLLNRMGQRGLRRLVFLTFKFNAYICRRVLGSSSLLVFCLWSGVWKVPIAIFFSICFCFIAGAWTWTQPILNPCAHNTPVSGVKQMMRQRKI